MYTNYVSYIFFVTSLRFYVDNMISTLSYVCAMIVGKMIFSIIYGVRALLGFSDQGGKIEIFKKGVCYDLLAQEFS